MELKSADAVAALKIAKLAIERRNTIPILSCFLLAPPPKAGAAATIMSTDLDLELTIELPAASWSDADRAAAYQEAGAMQALIANAGGDSVSFAPTPVAHVIDFRAGNVRGELKSLPGEDFPRIAQSSDPLFSCEFGGDVLDAILRVSGAMSTEETRYYLNGVYMHHVEGWDYAFAATDGHRLHRAIIPFPGAVGTIDSGTPFACAKGVIIPRKTIDTLRKLRGHIDAAKPIALELAAAGPPPNSVDTLAPETEKRQEPTRATLRFTAYGRPVTMVTKLIDGTFPDYSRVIPSFSELHNAVTFRAADLARALRAMTAGMSERTRAVKLTFDPAGKLIVTAKWIDAGFEGKFEIEARTRTPKGAFEVGFNGRYLNAMLATSRGGELLLDIDDAASPSAIVDPESDNFISVLMPMRV